MTRVSALCRFYGALSAPYEFLVYNLSQTLVPHLTDCLSKEKNVCMIYWKLNYQSILSFMLFLFSF